MRFRRFWPVWAACVLIVSGCSLGRFGYGLAPSLALWRIESYVTLTDAQRDLLTRRLDALHAWHRDTQLTRYARLLREVDDGMRLPVDARTVGKWRAEVMGWWPTLAVQAAPALVEFARTLSPVQLAEIRARFDDSLREESAKFKPADPAALVDARVARLRERAEFFLGNLNDAQLRALRQMAAALPPTEDAWLAERRRRGLRMIALVERLAAGAESQQAATEHARHELGSLWSRPDPANAEAIDAAIAAADAVYARLLNMATPAQRQTMHERLQGWISDAKTLADSGGAQRGAAR